VPFRTRQDARAWFRDLHDRKEFRIEFDDFYFCFIAVTSKRRKAILPIEQTPELIDYFPDHYNGARAQTMIALFLKSELDELGVALNEKRKKHDVHTAIAELVDYGTQSRLSTAGMLQFNRYAHGGFEVLTEWFDDRPRQPRHRVTDSVSKPAGTSRAPDDVEAALRRLLEPRQMKLSSLAVGRLCLSCRTSVARCCDLPCFSPKFLSELPTSIERPTRKE
jgi:hypothetical protein